ncbi:hypothetical protein CSA37_05725 [Candidatus Fermentibacteria bacterium]|nr:MAG: hypothetical protein CSA37_13195 [Candidatus Fermentibacteria bacterium]PIE52582.1 MAG: hypothetical protein CSA37_05725 [Candidatus Fermentibacteria bacterium]
MVLLFSISIMLAADTTVPAYILEYPGIDFMYLPEFMIPLSEGVLTEENGFVSCQPNEEGISFLIQYWKGDTAIADREVWIEQKLTGALSPEILNSNFNAAEPDWREGSMLAGVSSQRSVGLVTMINFTMMLPDDVYGIGRAYGVFRNGYSILLVAHGPVLSRPQEALTEIINMMVLSD